MASHREERLDRSEGEIIAAVLDGDVEAFAVLVRRHEAAVYGLMLRAVRCEHTARDLCQETFVRAYARLPSFQPDRRFFPWVYSVGVNILRDHFRRLKASPEHAGVNIDELPEPPGSSGGSEEMLKSLVLGDVERALGELPLEYREALLLRYREDLSMQEVAQALRLSPSGAKMRVHRGLALLRAKLGVGGRNGST